MAEGDGNNEVRKEGEGEVYGHREYEQNRNDGFFADGDYLEDENEVLAEEYQEEQPTKDGFLSLLNDLPNEENKQFLLEELKMMSKQINEEIKFKDVSAVIDIIFNEPSSDFPFSDFLDTFVDKMQVEDKEKLLVLILSKIGTSPLMVAYSGIQKLYQSIKSKNKCIRYSLNLILKHYESDLEDRLEVFIENIYRLVFKQVPLIDQDPIEVVGLCELYIKGLDYPGLRHTSDQILSYLLETLKDDEFSKETERLLVNKSSDWLRLLEWKNSKDKIKHQVTFRSDKDSNETPKFEEVRGKQFEHSEGFDEENEVVKRESSINMFENQLKELEERTKVLMRNYNGGIGEQKESRKIDDGDGIDQEDQEDEIFKFNEGLKASTLSSKQVKDDAFIRLKEELTKDFKGGEMVKKEKPQEIYYNPKFEIEEAEEYEKNGRFDDDNYENEHHEIESLLKGEDLYLKRVDNGLNNLKNNNNKEGKSLLKNNFIEKENKKSLITENPGFPESEHLRSPNSIKVGSTIKPKESYKSDQREDHSGLDYFSNQRNRFKEVQDELYGAKSKQNSNIGYSDFMVDEGKITDQRGTKESKKSIENSELSKADDYGFKFKFEKEKKAHQETVNALKEVNDAFQETRSRCLQQERDLEKLEKEKKKLEEEISKVKDQLESDKSSRSIFGKRENSDSIVADDPLEQVYLFYKTSKNAKERENSMQFLLYNMTSVDRPAKDVLSFLMKTSEFPDKPFLIDLRDALQEIKSVKGINRGMYEGLLRYALKIRVSPGGNSENSNLIVNFLVVTQNLDMAIDSLISILKDEIPHIENKLSKGKAC